MGTNPDRAPVDAADLDAIVCRGDHNMLVVTATADGEHAGCLVGFHTQSSIDPWRYTVCLSKLNHTYAVARKADHLLLHFLDESQHRLAHLFGGFTDDAMLDREKVDLVEWRPGPDGVTPLLAGVDDWVLGRIEAQHHRDGDHGLFVVSAVAAGHHAPDGSRPFRYSHAADIAPGHPA